MFFEAIPNASYDFTTRTSVAAAHVSGVAALIIERAPEIDNATLENILFSTAKIWDRRGATASSGSVSWIPIGR
jgi:subtilisin family serine protease